MLPRFPHDAINRAPRTSLVPSLRGEVQRGDREAIDLDARIVAHLGDDVTNRDRCQDKKARGNGDLPAYQQALSFCLWNTEPSCTVCQVPAHAPGSSELDRRLESEHDERHQKSGSGYEEHPLIHNRLDRHRRSARDGQIDSEAGHQDPHHDPGRGSASEPNQHAFAEQLSDKSPASGPQRPSHGELMAPGRAAGKHQIGEIRTGHDENQPHE